MIRPVASTAEFLACEEIQRRAFGYADRDIVPKNELISIARSGGLVLGAFEEGGEMLGFVFGFVGRDHRSGALYHSSRMVAVVPEARRRGLALALKYAQRDAVLAQGLREIRWTFDPLAAGNARLNLHKLGAVANGYVRDLYGPSSSPLHAHGTDRLTVTWVLDRPRRAAPADAERIALPAGAPGNAARAALRERFEDAFARGLVAVDFVEGAYVLVPGGK